jgi:phosphatidylglycerophosphate synthase
MHQYGGTMRAVQAFPVTGAIALVTMGAALAVTVGLSEAGWVVGMICGVVMNAALARGVLRYGHYRLGPADWVTLARATVAVGVAALVADSFDEPAHVTLLVTLSAIALALDAVDGWVARRSRTASRLGARFDGEVDAFLILVLSVYVARSTGAWVLLIGAARYAFFAAGWLLPWLREPLPPRYWRKVVAASQGVVLTIAAAHVLPGALTQAAVFGALALLCESFGRDVWWLWAHRHAVQSPAAAVAAGDPATLDHPRGRVRRIIAAGLTIAAVLFVWAALVAPDHPGLLTPSALVRLPLEGLVVIAVALALPATPRRVLAWVVGPVLGLLVIVKVLDLGVYAAFDRPFDPIADWRYTGIGIETLRDTVGPRDAYLVVAGAATLIVGLLVLTTLAVRRLLRVVTGHPRWSLPAVVGLGAVWVLCWAFGAQLVSRVPVASTSAAGLAVDEVRAVRAGIRDRAMFADEVRRDRFRGIPGDQLLTGLRGKDVIVVFLESYGRVAVQDSSFSPRVDAVLDRDMERLSSAGFHARSGFLTSPTFGGASWLAHSTLQSGVWVNRQWRYDQLVAGDRFTLSQAFKRSGWRTVDYVPADDRDWSQGSFYGYDKVYDQRNLGYVGPRFAFAPMPDQYVFQALQRLELAKRDRRPLFAEVDTVSSHAPWTRIPKLIDWDDVGDGSVFNRLPVSQVTTTALWGDHNRVRAAYARSIEYSLNTLFSFVQNYGDDDLVLVVLGDHQPSTIVTGLHPDLSHDVPISVIAHDQAVLNQIAGWGWEDGLRPSPRAPAWPMDAFRDRFLSAFGTQPAAGRGDRPASLTGRPVQSRG